MSTVSVVTELGSSLADLRRFVTATDRLTHPVADFEVVVLTAGTSTGEADPPGDDGATSPDRTLQQDLAQWQHYRPNIRVLAVEGPQDQSWRSTLTTDYLLHVGIRDALAPDSLGRLIEVATSSGADVVAGRVMVRGVPAAFDQHTADDALPSEDEAPLVRLVRRVGSAEAGDSAADPDEAAGHAARLVNPAVAVRSAEPVAVTRVAAVDASWVADRLELSLRLSGPVERARLSLLNSVTLQSFLVDLSVDADEDGGAVATIALPLGVHADPAPLSPGAWQLQVEVQSTAENTAEAAVFALPAVPVSVALVEDRFCVIGGREGDLLLEIAPRGGRLPAIEADRATVTETARGSLLEVAVPTLHVHRSHGVPALVQVGTIGFPGHLEIEDETAVLRAMVSGIAGTAPISLRFGPGGVRGTGLSLAIDGVGAMRVVPTPPNAPKVKAASPAPKRPKPEAAAKAGPTTAGKKKAKKRPRPSGPVARIRRAVPEPLEPLVSRLAATPPLRRLYRRLTGTAGRRR